MNGCTETVQLRVGIAVAAVASLALFAGLLVVSKRAAPPPDTDPPLETTHMPERPDPAASRSIVSSTFLDKSLLSFGNALSQLPEEVATESVATESVSGPVPISSADMARYSQTAIGAVIKANDGRVPASGEELWRTLKKLGDFAQLPIPFSSVALDSGLSHPRVVITACPPFIPNALKAPKPPPAPVNMPAIAGLGGTPPAKPEPPKREKPPEPKKPDDYIGKTPPNRPNLVGRLFLAANLTVGNDSRAPRVQTVEFISWNSHLMRFDFGVIEGMGGTPVLKFVDGVRCVTCHKNKGPILGTKPWSNSTHDGAVSEGSDGRFRFEFENGNLRDDIDGMLLMSPRAAEVDTSVRIGSEMLHSRKLFRALAKTPAGRETLLTLMAALVESEPLEQLDRQLKPRINSLDLTRFMYDVAAIQKTAMTSRLIDFIPNDKPVTKNRTTWWDGGLRAADYDERRAAGHHGLTAAHVPSNPKAFQKLPAIQTNLPGDIIGTVMLARTIGLTEGDRVFLKETLASTVRATARFQLNSHTIARRVFDGPQFADVFATGELPDRDDFKDRFVTSLRDALSVDRIDTSFLRPREEYATTARRDPNHKVEDEIERLPSTSCLRCHDIGSGKKTPSPIPQLAFDPFNPASRSAWVATADRKAKQAVLSRLLKRIATDQDMPPADSAEFELFRLKNPASFEETKRFLEAELKKVRGE